LTVLNRPAGRFCKKNLKNLRFYKKKPAKPLV